MDLKRAAEQSPPEKRIKLDETLDMTDSKLSSEELKPTQPGPVVPQIDVTQTQSEVKHDVEMKISSPVKTEAIRSPQRTEAPVPPKSPVKPIETAPPKSPIKSPFRSPLKSPVKASPVAEKPMEPVQANPAEEKTENNGENEIKAIETIKEETSTATNHQSTAAAEPMHVDVKGEELLDEHSRLTSVDVSMISNSDIPDDLIRVQLKYCLTTVKNLKRLKDVGPFLKPVDPVALNIPDYFNIIKHPMDLGTVQKKLETNQYPTPAACNEDILLVFKNCYQYNGPDSFVTKMAQNVEKAYLKYMEKMPKEVKADKKKKTSAILPDTSFDSARPKREVSSHIGNAMQTASPIKKKGPKNAAEIKFCGQVLREITSKKYASFNYPFLVPVDPIALGIPHYTQIIKHPMDLSTVRKRLEQGYYINCAEFEADVQLMLNNCFTFNRPGEDVYEMGKKMEALLHEKMAAKPVPGAVSASPVKRNADGESSDEEYENQQIALLQQNLALMSSQLAMLMEKRKKRKERRKHETPAANHSFTAQKSASKKASFKDSIPEITFDMKRELSEKINDLSQELIIEVFKIIREGMPSLETRAEEEEIELDIDTLDKVTLYKLYKFVKDNTRKKKNNHTMSSSESGSDSD